MPRKKIHPRQDDFNHQIRLSALIALGLLDDGQDIAIDGRDGSVLVAIYDRDIGAIVLTILEVDKVVSSHIVNISKFKVGYGFKRQLHCPSCEAKCQTLFSNNLTWVCRVCSHLVYDYSDFRTQLFGRLLKDNDKLHEVIVNGSDRDFEVASDIINYYVKVQTTTATVALLHKRNLELCNSRLKG